MLGGHGQDDVGEVAVVLHPGVLGHDGLDGGVLIGLHEQVAVVPTGDVAGGVGPDHVDPALARTGVDDLVELELVGGLPVVVLVGHLAGGEHVHAVPLGVAVHDGLVHQAAGDELGGGGQLLEQLHQLGHLLLLLGGEHEALHVDLVGQVALDGTQGVTDMGHGHRLDRGEGDGEVLGPHVPLDHLGLVDAGLAQAAHTQQHDLQTGGLGGVGAADEAAAVAVEDADGALGPVAGQSLDSIDGHAALLAGPLGGLGNAVLPAHHIVHELVKAVGVLGDILLVIGLFLQPEIGDGQLKRRVGVGQHGDPLVGVDRGGIVQVGADENGLDAQFTEPEAQPAGQMHAEAQRGDLGVAAPVQQAVAVLGHVGDQIGLRGHLAHRLAAPDMLGAPVPALPGVHVAHLQGIAAHQGQQTVGTAVAGRHILALAVHIGLAQHRLGAIGLLHAHQLVGADLGRFVPADADILALAAILGIALPLGVPVHPLQGIADAVLGVHPGLIAQAEVGGQHPVGRGEGAAPGLHGPGVAVLLHILLIIEVGADPGDLAVVGVHIHQTAALRSHQAEADDILNIRLELVAQIDYLLLKSFNLLNPGPPARSSLLSACSPADTVDHCTQYTVPLRFWETTSLARPLLLVVVLQPHLCVSAFHAILQSFFVLFNEKL